MNGIGIRNGLALGALAFASSTATAQWDPANGQWGKEDPRDVRIMTWNVEDGIRTSIDKTTDGPDQWAAIVRIIAAMKPDFLLLQETGDNGCFNCVDNTGHLTNVIELMFHGGTDIYNGNVAVGPHVQLYDPAYDLPYIFVGTEEDGFNRNVIVSRWDFASLNGDLVAKTNDISVQADEYAPGGDGGIRGFMFAEVDLPDADYAGDIVIGNAHLKAGGQASDLSQRLNAAKNVAYYMDYLLNGAGTGVPDPNNKIVSSATTVLDENTPFVIGGDWNEDESSNGRRGPAAWLTEAEFAGNIDGTDRDRTDSVYDDARDVFTNSDQTFVNGSSKVDHLAWQDDIATLRRAWVLNSKNLTITTLPPEMNTIPIGYNRPDLLNTYASDHLPVIMDISLAAGLPPCPADLNGDDVVDGADLAQLLAEWGGGPGSPSDLTGDGAVDGADLAQMLAAWGPC